MPANKGVELTWCVRDLGVHQNAKEAMTDLNVLRAPGKSWWMGLSCIDNSIEFPWNGKSGNTVVLGAQDVCKLCESHVIFLTALWGNWEGGIGLLSQMRGLWPWKVCGFSVGVQLVSGSDRPGSVWSCRPALHLQPSGGLGERPVLTSDCKMFYELWLVEGGKN